WNGRGTPMLYTSSSRALCVTEIAVHMPLGLVPNDYAMVTLELPNVKLHEIKATDLPKTWNSFPHSHTTQLIGDRFVREAKHLVMKVPSAAVQGEFNFLINPRHKDIAKVKVVNVEPFRFDVRLFNR
ncbi:MAG TPA: RES family NAD+ phosphorylase, partial [Chitinophagales bacterium]|nr:RES family NAD+ phosphorylase [Chitinophagales bacterium]